MKLHIIIVSIFSLVVLSACFQKPSTEVTQSGSDTSETIQTEPLPEQGLQEDITNSPDGDSVDVTSTTTEVEFSQSGTVSKETETTTSQESIEQVEEELNNILKDLF